MRSKWIYPFLIVIWGILAFKTVSSPLPQNDTTCRALAGAALTQTAQNCADLGANQVCLGSPNVTAAAGSNGRFSQSGDRLTLVDLQSLQSSGANPDQNAWGVIALNGQAGLPAGKFISYLLLGEARLQNQVAAADALKPGEPIEVVTLVGANMRGGPSREAAVLGSVRGGLKLQADAISPDRNWLRVVYKDGAAWVSAQVVASKAPFDQLPILREDSRSPLQNLCFQSSPSTSACGVAAPSLLLIQTPGEAVVKLRINGLDVAFNGTLALQGQPDQQVRLTVLSGLAEFGIQKAPPGFKVALPMAADGCTLQGEPGAVVPLSAADRAGLSALTAIPKPLLAAGIQIPSEADIQAAALKYFGVVYGPAAGQLDCTRFRPISPIGTAASGITRFFWESVPAATRYRLRLYNPDGQLLGTYTTNANTANIAVDLSNPGFGAVTTLLWEVEALLQDQLACTTRAAQVARGGVNRPITARSNNPGGTGGGGGGNASGPGVQPSDTPVVAGTPTAPAP